MDQLEVQDGVFKHPDVLPTLKTLEAVITNVGILSRSYASSNGVSLCWSLDNKFPSEEVPTDTKQAARCLDCKQSIKQRSGFKGTPCKFFTVVRLFLPATETVCLLRLGAVSLFSRHPVYLSLFKYHDYLKTNGEELEDILTNIYLGDDDGVTKIYFKPVRPLTRAELINIKQLNFAALENHNPFHLTIEENFMSDSNAKYHVINNVAAFYPRLDKPYFYDKTANNGKGKSVPCDATTPNACFETSFLMDEAQAATLYTAMQKAYTNSPHRDDSWPDKLPQPFNMHEEQFVGKAKLKAMYKNEVTNAPAQFDASNTRLPDDFMLTTGSMINLFVEFVPYNINGSGVSMRLKGVQVIKYIPYAPPSPFQAQEGFVNGAAPQAEPEAEPEPETMFAAVSPAAAAPPEEDIPDAVPEPVKRTNKKVKPLKKETDLASVIDKWAADGS